MNKCDTLSASTNPSTDFTYRSLNLKKSKLEGTWFSNDIAWDIMEEVKDYSLIK